MLFAIPVPCQQRRDLGGPSSHNGTSALALSSAFSSEMPRITMLQATVRSPRLAFAALPWLRRVLLARVCHERLEHGGVVASQRFFTESCPSCRTYWQMRTLAPRFRLVASVLRSSSAISSTTSMTPSGILRAAPWPRQLLLEVHWQRSLCVCAVSHFAAAPQPRTPGDLSAPIRLKRLCRLVINVREFLAQQHTPSGWRQRYTTSTQSPTPHPTGTRQACDGAAHSLEHVVCGAHALTDCTIVELGFASSRATVSTHPAPSLVGHALNTNREVMVCKHLVQSSSGNRGARGLRVGGIRGHRVADGESRALLLLRVRMRG